MTRLSADAVVVVWLNLVGFAIATVTAWVAVVRVREFRPLQVAKAQLATIYLVGYWWLLATDVAPAHWSETMRWFGPLAIALAWIWPDLRLMRKVEAERHHAEKLLAELGTDGGPG